MSSCGDDDFGLLGDESQSHPPHLQHHHHQHQQQPPAASVPFITHRYVSPSSKGSTSLLAVTNNHQHQSSHHQQRLHHQHLQHHHARPSRQHHSLKEDLISEKGTGEEVLDDIRREEEDAEDGDDDDEGNYAGGFVHHREDEDGQALPLPPPKTLSAVASSFHRDVDCCFRDNASNPFGQSLPDDEVAENNDHDRRNGEAVEQKPCGPGAVGGTILPITTHSNNNTKRRDRDELSDDGASPFCYATTATAPGAGGSKKSRPSALISPSPPPVTISGDYRKDREEWSDSAIGCLLDAYTDKYIQLNRGNLRGRDWEEVATVVSERCDKQKSCKSVEQCKNKVDNLKKRYKAERQRISSGSLSISHWPWFKKMEQIVGSSSASTAFSKPISDDDKSTTASVVIAACGGGLTIKQTKRYLGSTAGNVSLTGNLKMKSSTARWHRVVLKISGAIFAGSGPQNVEPKVTMLIAREISIAVELGVQVAVVVGGRNFFCGEAWVAGTDIDRATAYQVG